MHIYWKNLYMGQGDSGDRCGLWISCFIYKSVADSYKTESFLSYEYFAMAKIKHFKGTDPLLKSKGGMYPFESKFNVIALCNVFLDPL
jgi:hypothetical protein